MIVARKLRSCPAACSGSGSAGSLSRPPSARASRAGSGTLPDGHVEILAEGDAEAMERFERAVRRGPGWPRAWTTWRRTVVAPTGRFPGFIVPALTKCHSHHGHIEIADPVGARLPQARHPLLRHHDAAARPGRLQGRARRPRHAVCRPGDFAGRRHREPRVHPRRGGGRPAGGRLLPDPQAGQAAGQDHPASRSRWSTAPTRSRFTRTRSSRGSGC